MSVSKDGKPPKVKTILISQPAPEKDKNPYAALASKYNLTIEFRSFTHVEGLTAKDYRVQRLPIDKFTAVIFNSRIAIDHFFRMCADTRVEVSSEMKYFCVSETVANYVQKHTMMRKRKVFFGENKLADLVPIMQKHKGESFIFPVSDAASNEDFMQLAADAELSVKEATMFRTVNSDLSDLSDVKYDMLVFFTPSGINSLYYNFPDFEQGPTRLAAFGTLTQKAILDHSLRLDVAAPAPNLPSMTMAIEDYVKRVNGK